MYNEQVLVDAKRMQDQAGKLLQHYADEDGAFAQEKVRARAGDGVLTPRGGRRVRGDDVGRGRVAHERVKLPATATERCFGG